MENLDKLTAAGLPIFDLNAEKLDREDWCVPSSPACTQSLTSRSPRSPTPGRKAN
jgi:hypothetical protein